MKLLLAAASVAAMSFAAPAFAADWTYYGNVGLDTLNTGGENLRAASVRLGSRTEHFGVEGEAAFGIADTDLGGGVSIKIKDQEAVYAVAYLPSGENADLFARVGYGRVKVEASAGGGSASASDSTWNAGVGGQYFFDGGANGVRFDVTHSWWDAGGDSDTISIAYVRKFGK